MNRNLALLIAALLAVVPSTAILAYRVGLATGEKRVFEDCVDSRVRIPTLRLPTLRDAGVRRDVWWNAPPREAPSDVPPVPYRRPHPRDDSQDYRP